jgi:hypothetical protein
LGATHEDAVLTTRQAGPEIVFLVCDGFDPALVEGLPAEGAFVEENAEYPLVTSSTTPANLLWTESGSSIDDDDVNYPSVSIPSAPHITSTPSTTTPPAVPTTTVPTTTLPTKPATTAEEDLPSFRDKKKFFEQEIQGNSKAKPKEKVSLVRSKQRFTYLSKDELDNLKQEEERKIQDSSPEKIRSSGVVEDSQEREEMGRLFG